MHSASHESIHNIYQLQIQPVCPCLRSIFFFLFSFLFKYPSIEQFSNAILIHMTNALRICKYFLKKTLSVIMQIVVSCCCCTVFSFCIFILQQKKIIIIMRLRYCYYSSAKDSGKCAAVQVPLLQS